MKRRNLGVNGAWNIIVTLLLMAMLFLGAVAGWAARTITDNHRVKAAQARLLEEQTKNERTQTEAAEAVMVTSNQLLENALVAREHQRSGCDAHHAGKGK